MDVALHASTTPEPFGRVIVEAMALSKPIVAARAGGVPEIIVEGETGLMFTPGRDDELASCTLQLLENTECSHRMGVAAYERVHKTFHIRDNVNQTMAVYQSILR